MKAAHALAPRPLTDRGSVVLTDAPTPAPDLRDDAAAVVGALTVLVRFAVSVAEPMIRQIVRHEIVFGRTARGNTTTSAPAKMLTPNTEIELTEADRKAARDLARQLGMHVSEKGGQR